MADKKINITEAKPWQGHNPPTCYKSLSPGQSIWQRMNGTSESASVVLTLAPERPTHAKSPKNVPRNVKGKIPGGWQATSGVWVTAKGVNSCLAAEKEPQSALKTLYCYNARTVWRREQKGEERRSDVAVEQWRYVSVDVLETKPYPYNEWLCNTKTVNCWVRLGLVDFSRLLMWMLWTQEIWNVVGILLLIICLFHFICRMLTGMKRSSTSFLAQWLSNHS